MESAFNWRSERYLDFWDRTEPERPRRLNCFVVCWPLQVEAQSAQNVNTLIRELALEGTTVFLCTHQLRYAQEICTTYGLMNKGSLFAAGDIEKLRSMVSNYRKVRVKASYIPGDIECRKVAENIYDIDVNSEQEIPLIVKRIVDAGGGVYHVSEEQMSLEEIYFSLIDRNHAEMECDNK